MRIVTFDEADETLAGIKEGAIHATVVQQPIRVRLSGDQADGAGAAWRPLVHPESKQIIVPTQIVNRANVGGVRSASTSTGGDKLADGESSTAHRRAYIGAPVEIPRARLSSQGLFVGHVPVPCSLASWGEKDDRTWTLRGGSFTPHPAHWNPLTR